MICEEQPTEFRSLEKVFAVILRTWHSQYLYSIARLICSWAHKLCLHSNIRLSKLFHRGQWCTMTFLSRSSWYVWPSSTFLSALTYKSSCSSQKADVRWCISALGILELTNSIVSCATDAWLYRTQATCKATFHLDSNPLSQLEPFVVLQHQPISIC